MRCRDPFTITFSLVMLFGCSSFESTPDDARARLDRYFAELQAGGFSGVVLVDRAGVVDEIALGLADREAGRRVDLDSVFDIGSVTKQFTAAAILRLEMEGQLSVQDPLSLYVAGLPASKQVITIHQLLTHTAGLVSDVGGDYEPVTRDEFIRRFAESSLLHRVGERYAYANTGYSMLAVVIELVTGQSYEAYLAQALFEPSGMRQTGYVLPDWDDKVAVGYGGDERFGRPNEQPWAPDGPYWNLRGNGGLLSTAGDMHRWHKALLGESVLDAQAKAKLYGQHTPEGVGAPTYYGYGWALFPTAFDTTLITHNGGNGVFFADFLRFLDEDVTIFVATNAARGADATIGFEVARQAFGTNAVDPSLYTEPEQASCAPESLEDLLALPVLAEFPDSEAGMTARRFVGLVVEGGTEAQMLEFVENNLSDALKADVGTTDATVLVSELRQLQAELDGLSVAQILQASTRWFHITLAEGQGGQAVVVVSVSMAEEDASMIDCISIGN